MIFVFEVHVKEGHTADEYVGAWERASEIIQRATGARGTQLHRAIDRPEVMLAIAGWESKATRDTAEAERDPRVQAILDEQSELVDIRVVGEFGDPSSLVMPSDVDDEPDEESKD